MEEIITGYQWGDDNTFIGEYIFPNNLDKEDIHLPPRTTLIAPPKTTNKQVASWDGEKWILQNKPKTTITVYQWGKDNIYIGEYENPNDGILPPKTTLVQPPELESDQVVAVWNGNTWNIEPSPIYLNATKDPGISIILPINNIII